MSLEQDDQPDPNQVKAEMNTLTWTAWPSRLQPSQNGYEHHDLNSMAIQITTKSKH